MGYIALTAWAIIIIAVLIVADIFSHGLDKFNDDHFF